MTQNKLQHNDGKTETLFIDPQKLPNLPLSISMIIIQNGICFSRSVQNLGVIFWWQAFHELKQEVSQMCQFAYLELCRISSVRHVLIVDTTRTLLTSLILSHLDYCNSYLSGVPQQLLIDKLQKVQNCSTHFLNLQMHTFHHFWLNFTGFR